MLIRGNDCWRTKSSKSNAKITRAFVNGIRVFLPQACGSDVVWGADWPWSKWEKKFLREQTIAISSHRSCLPILGNPDHHPQQNESLSQNMHLRMSRLGLGLKLHVFLIVNAAVDAVALKTPPKNEQASNHLNLFVPPNFFWQSGVTPTRNFGKIGLFSGFLLAIGFVLDSRAEPAGKTRYYASSWVNYEGIFCAGRVSLNADRWELRVVISHISPPEQLFTAVPSLPTSGR